MHYENISEIPLYCYSFMALCVTEAMGAMVYLQLCCYDPMILNAHRSPRDSSCGRQGKGYRILSVYKGNIESEMTLVSGCRLSYFCLFLFFSASSSSFFLFRSSFCLFSSSFLFASSSFFFFSSRFFLNSFSVCGPDVALSPGPLGL